MRATLNSVLLFTRLARCESNETRPYGAKEMSAGKQIIKLKNFIIIIANIY